MKYGVLLVEKIGKHNWLVKEDWYTPFGIVPKGFRTDGATVPRILWWLFSPAGSLFQAGVLHDYLYITGAFDKELADRALQATALYYKVPVIRAKAAYLAVHFFGKGKYL